MKKFKIKPSTPRQVHANLPLPIFKAAMVALCEANTFTQDYHLDRAWGLFSQLTALELADHHITVDFETGEIYRECPLDADIMTLINAGLDADNELALRVSTMMVSDNQQQFHHCDFKIGLLGLDDLGISPYLRSMYDVFMLT